MKETLTIVYACDNNFAPLLAASIKSLEINSAGINKDIYIIDDNISETNVKKIKSSVQSEEINLHFVVAKKIMPKEYRIPYFKNAALPVTTFFRLFIQYFIPDNVEKVLYLDSDMIVLEHIKVLFDTDISDYILAAVQDPGIKTFGCSWGGGVKNYEELGFDADTKYFNAGLLLINIKKWAKSDICRLSLEYAVKYNKYIVYGDQYCLNAVLGNKWLPLSPLWNHLADSYVSDAHLIHYIGNKPTYTNYSNEPQYKELFFYYFNQTAWKNFSLVGRYGRSIAMVKRFIRKVIG